jgi:hypothetical protein
VLGCPPRSSFVETFGERRLDDQKLSFELWGSRARTTGCRQANELLRKSEACGFVAPRFVAKRSRAWSECPHMNCLEYSCNK